MKDPNIINKVFKMHGIAVDLFEHLRSVSYESMFDEETVQERLRNDLKRTKWIISEIEKIYCSLIILHGGSNIEKFKQD